MQRTLALVPLAASLLALSAAAQTGRTMRLLAPVEIGQSSGFVMDHPPSIAGNGFGFAMCSPTYPGAIPVSVPGVVEGVLRLTPLGYGVLGMGVLDSSGTSAAFTFSLPNDPLLVGATFDVQGADVDGFGLMTLTDNDLEVVVGPVAPAPPASLNMVAIAPGTFQMGSSEPVGQAPYYNQPQAQPVHSVTITQPFWMGKYEVTQAEYQALMGVNPSHFSGASRPVDSVTWDQAVAYCAALTSQEASAGRLPLGFIYRLPTEAEWDYCCRAGTTTEYYFGATLDCGQANYGYSHFVGGPCPSSGAGQTHVVGSYPANAWGLRDMHGNVSEWCLDKWDTLPNFPPHAVSDPYNTLGGDRVMKGGGWMDFSDQCRSAHRGWSPPLATSANAGFRVVCAPSVPLLSMASIAPGTFQMGSTVVGGDALPLRIVTITQPFWMGKCEVTQAEYQEVIGSNPSHFQGAAYGNNTNRPVEMVTWSDALAYCDALTVLEAAAGRLPTGYEYRLPTEAEWEYCCRAGTATEWNVGDSLDCTQANFSSTSGYCAPDPSTGGQTTPVGSYAASAWGLHDMHGNVWEWCLDSWDGSANYPAGAVSDPFVTIGPYRVVRGGGWYDVSSSCRSARRGWYSPGGMSGLGGFRVVCAPILP